LQAGTDHFNKNVEFAQQTGDKVHKIDTKINENRFVVNSKMRRGNLLNAGWSIQAGWRRLDRREG
jgi:hypothetical protein